MLEHLANRVQDKKNVKHTSPCTQLPWKIMICRRIHGILLFRVVLVSEILSCEKLLTRREIEELI